MYFMYHDLCLRPWTMPHWDLKPLLKFQYQKMVNEVVHVLPVGLGPSPLSLAGSGIIVAVVSGIARATVKFLILSLYQ